MGKDYYKILGVAKGANEAELKKGMYGAGSLIIKSCVAAAAIAVTEITQAAALANLGLTNCVLFVLTQRTGSWQWQITRCVAKVWNCADACLCNWRKGICSHQHARMNASTAAQGAPECPCIAACGAQAAEVCLTGTCRTRTPTTGKQQRPNSRTYQKPTRSVPGVQAHRMQV